jgi:hypothetical protein
VKNTMASTSPEVVVHALRIANAAIITYALETLSYDYPSILNIIKNCICIFSYIFLHFSHKFLKI